MPEKIRKRLGTAEALNVTALLDTLTTNQLKNLEKHKYSCSGVSLLEPLYKPWWEFAITLCPLWIAPNLITLVGLILNCSGFLLMAFYSGLDGKGAAPSWVYFYAAGSLFAYQTLDAIDGKQARRTGTGSPLGELFDHGMDCIANCFFLPMMALATQGGLDLDKSFILCWMCVGSFYTSHWVHYVTGSLTFGLIDITEIQTSTMGLFIMTGVFGPEYWSEDFVIGGIKNRDTVVYGSCFICTYALIRMTILIFQGGAGPNKSSVAGTSILSPGPNIILLLGIGFIVGQKTGLMNQNPILYMFYISLLGAKATHKLVVANLTKASLRVADPYLWSVCSIGFNQYMGDYIPPQLLFYALCLYAIVDMFRYCSRTYSQIAKHLKIEVLTIPKEKQRIKTN